MIFSLPPTENGDLTYEQVLEDVQRYFSENHASTIAGARENDSQRAVTVLKELMVQYLVKRKYTIKGLTAKQLCARLYEDMAGYSFLKKCIYQGSFLSQTLYTANLRRW